MESDKIKSAKEYASESDQSLRDGHRVLSRPNLHDLPGDGAEMQNVFGVKEEQDQSDEDIRSYPDARTNTHNDMKFLKESD